MVNALEVHQSEFEIARNPSDPRHIQPPLRESHRRILDVGCGMGQTLLTLPIDPDAEAWGIDCDLDLIERGQKLAPANIHLLQGHAEQLPFPDAHFDLVYSRVALPYTFLPKAIPEIARVLKPGGDFWTVMHPPRWLLKAARQEIASGNLRGVARYGLVGLNSIILHMFGRQFWIAGSCETVQTERAMHRLITGAGLTLVPVKPSRFMVFQAVKTPAS
jgi:SAM-dependent methyltransferase